MRRAAIERLAVRRSASADPEAGYVLLAVIFLTVVLLISLAIAAPKIAKSIQRDKELETVHRGEQYKRAIKLYYTKFGTYPTSIDQLVETNQMRFLRKKYTDPLTGKADWKPVLYGQAHVRPLGFFGQPLMTAGISAAGASMYAVSASTTTDANGVPIASPDGSGAGGASGSSGLGSSNSSFGSSNSGFGSSGSSFGSSGSSFGSSGSSFGSSSGPSLLGADPNSTTGSTTSSSFGPSGTGSSGGGTSATAFGGGGPIVGFTLPVDKPSLIEYKLQKRYNKWEFNYDPMEDQANALGGLTNGASTGGVPTSNSPFGGNNNSPFGGNNNSPFGGNNNPPFGGTNNGTTNGPGTPVTPPSNPTSPQDPTAPQQ